VFPRNDFWRAGEASRAVEQTYGLSVTAASDRTAAKRPSYAETAKAQRRGNREPVRDTLRRSVPYRRRRFEQPGRVPGPVARRWSDGPGAVQRTNPGAAERVLGRPAGAERPGREADLLRWREARRGPDAAEAAAPLGAGHPAGECRQRRRRRRFTSGAVGAGDRIHLCDTGGYRHTVQATGEDQHRGSPWRSGPGSGSRRLRPLLPQPSRSASAPPLLRGRQRTRRGPRQTSCPRPLGLEGRRGGPLTAAAEEYD